MHALAAQPPERRLVVHVPLRAELQDRLHDEPPPALPLDERRALGRLAPARGRLVEGEIEGAEDAGGPDRLQQEAAAALARDAR